MELKHYSCYINGEWLDSNVYERFEVENPANNEPFATITACTVDDVQCALESSEKAQFGWQLLPAQSRANYLYAICDRLKIERDHFAGLLVMEQGKNLVHLITMKLD